MHVACAWAAFIINTASGGGGGGAKDIFKGAQLFHISHIIQNFFDITPLDLKKTILQAPMPLCDNES